MRRLTATLAAAAALLCATLATAGTPPDVSLKQFISGGQVLGFDSGGYHVSNGTYALRVRFEHAQAVAPSADDNPGVATPETPASPLSRVSYSGLWDGISVTYDAPPGGIARSTW